MNFKKISLTFIVLLYFETIYHLFVFKALELKSIFFIIIFTLLSSIFIDIITNLFKHKNNKYFYITFFTLLSFIFIAQFINFKFYGNVISIYSMFNGGQVFGFFNQIVTVMLNNFFPLLLFILPIPILIILKNHLVFLDGNMRFFGYKILLLFGLYLISILILQIDQKAIYSAYNIYYLKHIPNQTAQTLGLITTMRLDIQRTLNGFTETVVIDSPTEEELPPPPIPIVYNVLDIDFENLIATENNKTIKNIHTYMVNESPTAQNEYTGYFAGKNLITFVAEGFSPIAVDSVLTPTLYKLVNTGFKFNNFYTPVYYVSTSDGEYVSLTGLLPKESVWSLAKSSKIYLPFTYGNAFKPLGYTTNAYHNGSYTYYDRHKSHPNMGYKFTACGNGLQKHMNCRIWPQSDIEMMNATIEMYTKNQPFMTYYMTISGHLEYNFFGNNMAYKNRKLVDSLSYSTAIKAYIATQIELDRAIEILLNKLEEQGILDDTVIVLSSDHYPYGLKPNEMKEVMTIEDEKLDIHKNHLVIWNSAMSKPIEVNKFANSLDVLPTVLNLFGIKYDSRLIIGKDILSDTEGLVIFNDRSWITKEGKYNASKKKFTPFNNSLPDPDKYIETINQEVYNKYVISKNILENDYYRKVFPRW